LVEGVSEQLFSRPMAAKERSNFFIFLLG